MSMLLVWIIQLFRWWQPYLAEVVISWGKQLNYLWLVSVLFSISTGKCLAPALLTAGAENYVGVSTKTHPRLCCFSTLTPIPSPPPSWCFWINKSDFFFSALKKWPWACLVWWNKWVLELDQWLWIECKVSHIVRKGYSFTYRELKNGVIRKDREQCWPKYQRNNLVTFGDIAGSSVSV